MVDAEDGYVGDRVYGDLAQLGVADFCSWVGGGFADDLGQGNTEREDLVHDVGQVEHDAGGGADVEVGGDGVGPEAGFDHGLCEGEGEGAAAVADVELDAALAGVEHVRGGFAVGAEQRRGHAEDVGADVSGAEDGFDHVLVGLVVEPAEVDHDRQVIAGAGLDGLLDGGVVGLLPVGGLDADDDVAVLGDGLRDGIDVHVVLVLLGDVALIFHARADNVDEGEDAGLGVLMMRSRNSGKSRQPEEPASATVVTPLGMDMGSAWTPRSPLPQALWRRPMKTWTWISTRPGVR